MTIEELRLILKRIGIREDAYSLNGEKFSESYVLDNIRNRYQVYYYERGQETSKQEFASENEACHYLLELLKGDKTVME